MSVLRLATEKVADTNNESIFNFFAIEDARVDVCAAVLSRYFLLLFLLSHAK